MKKYLLLAVLLAGCDEPPAEQYFTGYVEARQLLVAAPQSGWLKEQTVNEGQQVQAGQTLFRLESERENFAVQQAEQWVAQKQALLSDMQKGARQEVLDRLTAQVSEAKARFELAELVAARETQTAVQQLSSQASLDQAIANLAVAKAQVTQLEDQLAEAKLSARPDVISAAQADLMAAEQGKRISEWQQNQRQVSAGQSGWVDDVFYRPGEFVMAGTPVLSILLNGQFKVRFYVPVRILSGLQLGQRVNIYPQGKPDPLSGTISFVAKQAEFTPPVLYSKGSRDKLVFLVEADLTEDNDLPVGLPVDVSL